MLPGIAIEDERAGGPLLAWICDARELPGELVEALLDVRAKLIEQPLRYMPNLQGRRLEIFSILTIPADIAGRHVVPSPLAGHLEHLKAAPGRTEMRAASWTDLLDRE